MFTQDTHGSLKDIYHFITLFALGEKMNRIMKNICICFGEKDSDTKQNRNEPKELDVLGLYNVNIDPNQGIHPKKEKVCGIQFFSPKKSAEIIKITEIWCQWGIFVENIVCFNVFIDKLCNDQLGND